MRCSIARCTRASTRPVMRIEINYILEDNWPMLNAVKKLGAMPLRRYRVYEAPV